MSPENLTFAQPGVGPLETRGEDLTDVGEIEKKERNSDDSVEDRDDLADGSNGYNVPIT